MEEPRIDRNIVFGMYAGLALLMDVYRPERPNGFGVLFLGGSGWAAPPGWDTPGLKDKEPQLRLWIPALLGAGYTAFAVNHRAAPRFPYPAALEDIERAVRFIRSRAGDLGIEPSRIGAVGGSSGAHLACLAALRAAAGDPGCTDPVDRESSALQCLVLREAPTDLLRMAREGDEEGAEYVRAFLEGEGANGPSSPETYAAASPLHLVTRGAPPTLLIHGDADTTVPYRQSVAMADALRGIGTAVKLLTIPGGIHAPDFGAEDGPRPEWPDYLGEMTAWLDRYLMPPPGGWIR